MRFRSSAMPVPMATQDRGSSASCTGSSVSSMTQVVNPFNNDPPPVMMMPFDIISADSSGGVFSNVNLTVSIITETASRNASRISREERVKVLGKPVIMSRPRTGILFSFSKG